MEPRSNFKPPFIPKPKLIVFEVCFDIVGLFTVVCEFC
jgi:hypothetical protein